jgi:outer membrane murein-binding lipoprotein Lpp
MDFNEAKYKPLDDWYSNTNEKNYQLSTAVETLNAAASEVETEVRMIQRNREAAKEAY